MTGVGGSSRKVPTLREGPREAEGNPSTFDSEAKMRWEQGSVDQQSHEQWLWAWASQLATPEGQRKERQAQSQWAGRGAMPRAALSHRANIWLPL